MNLKIAGELHPKTTVDEKQKKNENRRKKIMNGKRVVDIHLFICIVITTKMYRTCVIRFGYAHTDTTYCDGESHTENSESAQSKAL